MFIGTERRASILTTAVLYQLITRIEPKYIKIRYRLSKKPLGSFKDRLTFYTSIKPEGTSPKV